MGNHNFIHPPGSIPIHTTQFLPYAYDGPPYCDVATKKEVNKGCMIHVMEVHGRLFMSDEMFDRYVKTINQRQ